MVRAAAAVGVAAVLLVTLVLGVALVVEPPLLDTPDERAVSTPAPTSAPTTSPAAGPAAPRPYSLRIDAIESCGTTCRDVTATLANQADESRRNVTVVTRIYADGDLLWTESERVGTLTSGETHTATARVELSLTDALAVEGNDGYVTVERTVRSDDGTAVLTRRRQVN